MDLGTIAAKMILDTSNFTSQLNLAQSQAQRAALEMNRSFQVGQAMTSLGKALTLGVTAPILGIAAAAVKVGNEFEAQMSRVQAISGATGSELKALNQQAIQLGADTMFSAKEAAQGMENLASAGFNVNEIMGAMPGTLDLAAVSGGDVAASADAMATSLRAFGLEATQAGHVADVFARAAADTNAEASDMAEAMKYVAPVAHAMGISLEETAASIGIMSDAGIKGSQAGTTLRGALSRLANPTKAMKASMDELGVSFYDAQGKMLPLKDQIAQLKKATAGLTDEERNRHLVTLYGQQSLSGMLALMEAGPEKIDALTNSLKNADGSAKQMAETMQQNLKSKIEQMKGAFESAGIIIQQILAPALGKIVDAITKVVQAFVKAPPGIQKMIVAFGAILAAVGPLLLIFGTIITTIAKVKTAIEFLGAGFMGTIGTVGLVVAAIAALVAIFLLAYNKSETFRNAVNNIATALKNFLGPAIQYAWDKFTQFLGVLGQAAVKVKDFALDRITSGLSSLAEKLGFTANTISGFFTGLWGVAKNFLSQLGINFDSVGTKASLFASVITSLGLGFAGLGGPIGIAIGLITTFIAKFVALGQFNAEGVKTVINDMVSSITGFLTNLSAALPGIMSTVSSIIVSVIQSIASALPGIVSTISSTLTTIGGAIIQALPTILEAGSQIIQALIQGITQILPSLIQVGVQILTSLVNAITQNLPAIIEAAVTIINTLVQAFAQALPLMLQAGITIMTALITAIVENLPTIIEAAIQIIMALVNAIIENLPMIIDAAVQLLQALIQALADNAPLIVDAAIQLINALLEGFIQCFPQMAAAAVQIISALGQAIIENLPTLIALAAQLIGALVMGIIQAIPLLLEAAWTLISTLVSTLLSLAGQFISAGLQWIVSAAQGMMSGIGSIIGSAVSAGSQAIGSLGSFIGQMLQRGAEWVRNVASGFTSGVGGVISACTSMASQAVSSVTSFAGQMISSGVQFVQGFIDGMGSMIGGVINKAASLAKSALEAVKGALGIHSPSRRMYEMGGYTGQGFINGLGSMIYGAVSVAKSMATQVSEAMSDVQPEIDAVGISKEFSKAYDTVQKAIPNSLVAPQTQDLLDSLANVNNFGSYVTPYLNKDTNTDLQPTGTKLTTNVEIGTIIVRDDTDLEAISRGLYDKDIRSLKSLGDTTAVI